MSSASFLDSIACDHHSDASARPRRRSRKEAQRRKQVRERLERALERRRFWTPEMVAAEEARLREVAKKIAERRAQDQDQAA